MAQNEFKSISGKDEKLSPLKPRPNLQVMPKTLAENSPGLLYESPEYKKATKDIQKGSVQGSLA